MRNARASLLATPSSQTNNQAKVTRLYNESLIDIEKSYALNPEKIFSKRINRWLNHQFDVRLLDQAALSWYLMGTVAHLCSDVFVYRNNREPIPNNLYLFLVCGSAFGKSVFYRHFSNAISTCPIYNENIIDQISSSGKESTKNITEAFHFLDEMSRGGMMKQLNQNDKIVLLDEADACLKRNGLIPDGPIGEHNNIYETVLTLYSGRATVTKSLTNSSINLDLKKLTILANTTEEPIIRLLKKKMSGDAPNPFAERSLFLFITTPLTLEQPFPPRWNFQNEPTINQVAYTASQLNNLDFYYETKARFMTIAYGNLLCKLMIKNEKIDKWFTARLGKSREHLHRLAINLQLIQLTFDLIDKYKSDFGDLNHGLNDLIFQKRMKHVVNDFLGRTNDQVRIKLEIRLSIAKSAIINTDDFQTTESDQHQFNTTTTLTATTDIPTSIDEIKDLARSILLFDEIAFTKTKLSHGIYAWKRSKSIHDAALDLLVEKKLIRFYGKGIKNVTTNRCVPMWIKCVPQSSDLSHLTDFQKSLTEFKIQWENFQPKLEYFHLWSDVVLVDNCLINLLKSPQYQPYIKFNIDSLTMIPNNINLTQANEEQNNCSLDESTSNASNVRNSTTSVANSPSISQQPAQSDSITTPVRMNTSASSGTSISVEIPVEQSAVLSQASLPSAATMPQFCLPRPIDLAETRLKQSAANKSRANKKKQIQPKK